MPITAPDGTETITLYNCPEVAQMIGVHRTTVYKWARAGKLHPHLIGAHRESLFTMGEVKRFLRAYMPTIQGYKPRHGVAVGPG